MRDLKYELWFTNLKLSNDKKNKLSDCLGGGENVYNASPEKLLQSSLVCEEDIKVINESKIEDLDKKYNEFLNFNQALITRCDEHFPEKLKTIKNSPYGLYVNGDMSLDLDKSVAIVGSRRCSDYGKWAADEIAYQLALRGYTIISGMALGIDKCAHKGALRAGGKTIAVLGCGVDICYPRSNIEIYMDIQKTGCIISELPPETKPLSYNFPLRNRIISGLSDIVIVIEASEKSGSLITADFALEQGKDVYALPGRISDKVSFGCNKLIAEGAGAIYSIEEFINSISEVQMNTLLNEENVNCQNFQLEKEELLVYSVLSLYPKSIEQIIDETELDLVQVLSAIMNLCKYKLIKETFVNQYIRVK